MTSRIGRLLGMVSVLLAAILASSVEQVAQTVAQSQAAATIIVSGLPEGNAASFREVRRNLDGSFSDVRDLGRLTNGQHSVQIDAGSFIGAFSLMVSENERYAVPVRFVPVPADGRLIATYRHEFHVTHIMWTHGPTLPPGATRLPAPPNGTISPAPGWYPAGSIVRLVAHPASGTKFLHWGVFGVGERVDVRTVTATGLELEFSIEPVQVVAAFGT